MRTTARRDRGRRGRAGGFPRAVLASAVVATLLVPATCAASFGGFIENRGQLPDEVLYYAEGSHASVFFMSEAVVLDLRDSVEDVLGSTEGDAWSDESPFEPVPHRGCAIWIRFDGATEPPIVEGRRRLPTEYNYFLGNDPEGWRTGIPAYREVVYRNLWPGIDLVYDVADGHLSFEAATDRGGDPSAVGFRYEGAKNVSALGGWGRRVETSVGSLLEERDRDGRRGSYRREEHPAGGSRDNPALLLWSTLIGGSDSDYVRDVALDSSGLAIATGLARSSNFPSTPGAYDQTVNGHDCFVAKFDATGSSLVWCSFLGSPGSTSWYEDSNCIAIDEYDRPIIAGYTGYNDFPVTGGAYDTSWNGLTDGFVTKFANTGSSLLWSTYLGGGGSQAHDYIRGIDLDADGNPIVTGDTVSESFPVTGGAYDTSHNGSNDCFVSKLNSSGTSLLWSTYIGASVEDFGDDVAVDQATGAPVVVGRTRNWQYPSTSGAFDEYFNGEWDAFVTRLAPDGGSLEWSSFLGGPDNDKAYSVVLDDAGNPVVTGLADTGFPTTAGAYSQTMLGGSDAFVTRFDASGSSLAWSTYLGGTADDTGWDVALDVLGNPVVVGFTKWGFPTTPDGYQLTPGGDNRDGFVTKLDASGSSLTYSSYLGGIYNDHCYAVALDGIGDGVIGGASESSNFPTTAGAFDQTPNGQYDGFVCKMDLPGVPFNPATDPEDQDLTASAPTATMSVNYYGSVGRLYAFSMKFTLDKAIVHTSVDSIAEGDLLNEGGTTPTFFHARRTAPNEITVDSTILGPHGGISGAGTMFTVDVAGVSYGSTLFDVEVISMRDPDNQEISRFASGDATITVDIVWPAVTDVLITNDTLPHTNDYAKDGDGITVAATVTDDDPTLEASNIKADLSAFGGGGAVTANSYASDVATWTLGSVACNPADGTVAVTVTATDGIGNAANGSDGLTSDNTVPTAIAGLAAAPGHEKVNLTWDDPTGTDAHYRGTLVRYAAWGDYPQYDAATPSYPSDETAGDGEAFDGLGSVSSAEHAIAPRDIYYYGAFAYDEALNYGLSDVSAQDRATSYWLGDVAAALGEWGADFGYNGLVNDADLDKLAGMYGTAPAGYFLECDVGPTDDNSRAGIPEPDDFVAFDDLMIFAMSYGVAAPRVVPFLPAEATKALSLELVGIGTTESGMVELALRLEGNAREVKGLSTRLAYDGGALEFVSARLSEHMIAPLGQVFFWYRGGDGTAQIDLAALGTDTTIGGSGDVAVLTFRPLADEHAVTFDAIDLRGVGNEHLLASADDYAPLPAVPEAFRLIGNSPNPFNPTTTIGYDVPAGGGRVRIEVFDVSGRLVTTLVDEVQPEGRTSITWHGVDERGAELPSGVYFYRMGAGDYVETRKMLLLK
jgi:hypothetical protein